MSKNLKIGKIGEDQAIEFLKEKGFKVLERNWENRYGEIDIIAQKDGKLIFVEVKTKTDANFGLPEESVGYKKKRRLVKNARGYLRYKDTDEPFRIDVVGVVLNEEKNVERIKHYKNITLFEGDS